ncbi:MAG: histidine decarboxylase [Flavobacteriales bacterium]|nr:histidine decarboxylase [Flavobacteriales bacterium]
MRRELDTYNQQKLDVLYKSIKKHSENFLGYPVSKDFNYEDLNRFLKFPINNLGDPFMPSTWKVDSREIEREVIEFMAELMRAPKDNWWGYVTNGGSEGNMYGLYLARELYPKGMVYFSQNTHYSVNKNLRILNMQRVVIKSQHNGELDYQDLKDTIARNRHMPPIIFANIGTTMKEAKDDLSKIKEIMDDLAIEDYYIHADGALSGMIAPFLNPRPKFDFADGADSMSISGHKFLGSPIPSGVVLAKKSNIDRIAKSIAYIGSDDTTIPGSRNGYSPLVWWYAIKSLGLEGLQKRVDDSLEKTDYTFKKLTEAGIEVMRNTNSITVVFTAPEQDVIERWQLATEKGVTHLIIMPNTPYEKIDEILEDIIPSIKRVLALKA